MQLEVDCSTCTGGISLANPKCLSGILRALSTGGVPDAIVLRSYIHKRYRGEAVERAAHVASELASINRELLSATLERPSDRRCRTCRASSESILTTLRRSMLDDPALFASDRHGFIARIREEVDPPDCSRAEECLGKVLRAARLGTE